LLFFLANVDFKTKRCLIESQIEIEQLNESLEQQLIEKDNLKAQITSLHSENEFSNKNVILTCFLVDFDVTMFFFF
jgi:cell division protein FtsL